MSGVHNIRRFGLFVVLLFNNVLVRLGFHTFALGMFARVRKKKKKTKVQIFRGVWRKVYRRFGEIFFFFSTVKRLILCRQNETKSDATTRIFDRENRSRVTWVKLTKTNKNRE